MRDRTIIKSNVLRANKKLYALAIIAGGILGAIDFALGFGPGEIGVMLPAFLVVALILMLRSS